MDITEELLRLAKETLGIVVTATGKDETLTMIIKAGLEDMKRAGAFVDTKNALVRNALMTYVKAYYGISDATEKEKMWSSYQLQLANLCLSSGYKKECDCDGRRFD